MSSETILIAGAGPTGLVLALWLNRLGVRVRLIDRLAQPGTTSRALAVQGRTLEFYEQLGLGRTVYQRGHKIDAINLWVQGSPAATVPIGDVGQGLTRFSYPLIFPQDEHERFLIERLEAEGVTVERSTELLGFEDDGTRITAKLQSANGTAETFTCSFLAGCDGAKSKVRETLGVGFPGGTYDHLFYVADVEATGPPMDGGLHVGLDFADFLAVFPLKDRHRARLIGSIRDTSPQGDAAQLGFEDVRDQAIQHLKIEIKQVNWFSTYRVHHRVAHQFRKGRAFLLGDAAHIHSPVGGQGMNTGIGDAVNLAWKLAEVLQGKAATTLLDSYEPERIQFARRLVATTDRLFKGVISEGRLARVIRTRAVPVVAPELLRLRALRRFAFRTVSQLGIHYRHSPLSAGVAGRVQGGDRLPWIRMANDADNFAPLATLRWQLHIYGQVAPEVRAFCAQQGLQLACYAWHTDWGSLGVERDAAYLVRPDGYVGLADPKPSVAALESYLTRAGAQLSSSGRR
jgi:2-polyprenyl-6-methoxyphenol hydroxylase-like FAD-dependent oxidoreductase